MIDRRRLIRAVAGSLVAVPLIARAQKSSMPVIGFLGNGGSATGSTQQGVFVRSLRELGWIEGQNVTIEYRSQSLLLRADEVIQ